MRNGYALCTSIALQMSPDVRADVWRAVHESGRARYARWATFGSGGPQRADHAVVPCLIASVDAKRQGSALTLRGSGCRPVCTFASEAYMCWHLTGSVLDCVSPHICLSRAAIVNLSHRRPHTANRWKLESDPPRSGYCTTEPVTAAAMHVC